MSYILDALRKAEAERERGAVPDLHAQALPTPAVAPPSRPPQGALWRWVALGAVLAIAAAAVWQLARRATPAAPSIAEAVRPAATPASAALTPAAAATAPAGPVASAAAAKPVPLARPERRPPAAEAAAPKGAAAAKAPGATKARSTAQAAKTTPAAKTARRAAAPVAARPPATRLPALAELPAGLRQQVPALAIGGSVYSVQPSARIVIVNGQVFQEGSHLAPRLTLEQIRPKSAVFSIDGAQFEVPL